MSGFASYLVQEKIGGPVSDQADMQRAASRLYRRTCARAWLGRLWAGLMGYSNHPRPLSTVAEIVTVRDRREVGVQQAPLDRIQGAEEHWREFDAAFCPLDSHHKEWWLQVATARLRGQRLPPIALIRVGDIYFIQEGHLRVSVAKALGEAVIDAQVTVWEIAPLPSWNERDLRRVVVGLG